MRTAFISLWPVPGVLFVAILTAGTLTPNLARADGRCPGSPIEVTGATQREFDLVCDGASKALRQLGACRIATRREIRIELRAGISHPVGRDAIAYYDTVRGIVLVPRFETVAATVAETPYRFLSPSEFYRSMVVHELVHAVLQQNARRAPQSRSEQEYPAYALQIASLSDSARARLLQPYAHLAVKGEFIFNDILLALDPIHFALRAYLHFSESGGGCTRLRSLLSGDADFIAILQ